MSSSFSNLIFSTLYACVTGTVFRFLKERHFSMHVIARIAELLNVSVSTVARAHIYGSMRI